MSLFNKNYDTDKKPTRETSYEQMNHTYNYDNFNGSQELHQVQSYTSNTSSIPVNIPDIPQNKTTSGKKHFKKFISVVLVVSVLFSITSAGIYSMCSKTDFVSDSYNKNENFFDIISSVSSTYNILIIGTDKNTEGSMRSDTIMIVNVDKTNNRINLISFLRDLWVEIPGYEKARLNSAYSLGGAELLIETLKYNFDIEIENYVQVDFQMFVEIIDALGGITVDITKREADFINRTTRHTVKSGEYTLNGAEALVYCRIRKLDSDFMRTQRQRKVVYAIFEKIKSQSIISTFSMSSKVLPLIRTNISPLKMTMLSFTAPAALRYELHQKRIPVEKSYSFERINGQSVIVPNIEKNKDELHKIIY